MRISFKPSNKQKPSSSRPRTAKAAMLLAKSRAYQDAADAPATLKAYDADYARFAAWCARHDFTAMPPTPQTVGAYLAAAGDGYAMPTLRRWVAAIARRSGMAGHPLDSRHPAIRETLRGISRRHGQPARRAAALTTDEIRQLCEACDTSLTGLRDRALFLVGFAGALRRSELVGLDIEHLKWTREGVTLLIVRSKSDKAGEGAEISIPRGTSALTCPVAALKQWLKAAAISTGPLFRKVNRAGRAQRGRLSGDAVRQILLKRATQAGIKGSRLESVSPHGMRAGFVTTAYRNGVADEEIMAHTRHRSLATMRSYVRRAKLSQSSPAGKVDL
jgi:integrase